MQCKQIYLTPLHGEKAHSCYFSKDAFKNLKGENKELLIIPDAVHTDLYGNAPTFTIF